MEFVNCHPFLIFQATQKNLIGFFENVSLSVSSTHYIEVQTNSAKGWKSLKKPKTGCLSKTLTVTA